MNDKFIQNKNLIFIIIVLVILLIYIKCKKYSQDKNNWNYNVLKDRIYENMKDEKKINIKDENIDTIWNRSKCNYKINKTFLDEFQKYNIKNSNDEWNLFIPCSYDNINSEMNNMEIKNGAKYFVISNADLIAGKNYLWENIVKHHGIQKASTMMPKSYVLNNKNEMKRFIKDYDNNKLYILKKNIQRQEGLKISDNKNEILDSVKDNFVIVQELLQNPYIIDGRKTNMRFYILVTCNNYEINVYVYNDGFMYYTPKKFIIGSKDKDVNITTGYIDRKVYAINPLTHKDLHNYLDNHERQLTDIEKNIRKQGLKISKIYFDRINSLIKDIFISYVGNICNDKKFSNNMTFQLFGADIAVDNELNPMIMEINKGPDMGAKDTRDSELKHNVVRDMLNIIGAINNKEIHQKNGFINVLKNIK